jgi:hypothetical protein
MGVMPGTAEAETTGAGIAVFVIEAEPAAVGVGVVTGVLAFCVADDGKNVGFWPLWTCHWSHNKTMEKPKITHKMVRRMSFMTVSF